MEGRVRGAESLHPGGSDGLLETVVSTWQWAGGHIMEFLQSQTKEFDLNLISSGEPLRISGCRRDGLKAQITSWCCEQNLPEPGLLITEGREVLRKTEVLNPLFQ